MTAMYDIEKLAKPAAVPCVKCQTTGGRGKGPFSKPFRIDGEKYGLAGKLCDACYVKEARALKREQEGREPAAKGSLPPVKPCAKCGTTGGRCPTDSTTGRPHRRKGDRYGFFGWVCLGCYEGLGQVDRAEIGNDYQPDEAEIRREKAAIRAAMEAYMWGSCGKDRAAKRMRANAERAKVERARAIGERLAGMGRACGLARG